VHDIPPPSPSTPDERGWFIGYRGDLAFAALVEGGGTDNAGPIANAFCATCDQGLLRPTPILLAERRVSRRPNTRAE
jgi:hypothetical protein